MGLAYEVIASLDIGYVTLIQVSASFFLSLCLDRVFPHDNNQKKGTLRLLVETGCLIGVLMAVLHYVALGVRRIPFPLLGVWGYKTRISEWKGLTLLSVFALIYCDSIQSNLNTLRKRETLRTTRESQASPKEIANF